MHNSLVYQVRAHHKITIPELATLLGVTPQMVGSMESGRNRIPKKIHEKLMNILGKEPINPNRIPVRWR